MNGFFHGGGMIWVYFFWIFLIIASVIFVKRSMKFPNRESCFNFNETPLDILKKRYAKGEISKEQFEEAKKHLDE